MNKFWQWPYVKRHYSSKGITDIVAIKACYCDGHKGPHAIVVFPQCKFSSDSNKKMEGSMSKKEKQDLVNYAKDCGAYPLHVYSYKHKTIFIDLNTGMAFIP